MFTSTQPKQTNKQKKLFVCNQGYFHSKMHFQLRISSIGINWGEVVLENGSPPPKNLTPRSVKSENHRNYLSSSLPAFGLRSTWHSCMYSNHNTVYFHRTETCDCKQTRVNVFDLHQSSTVRSHLGKRTRPSRKLS